MWMMSVPIATWTVSGIRSRAAAAVTLVRACGGLVDCRYSRDRLPETEASSRLRR